MRNWLLMLCQTLGEIIVVVLVLAILISAIIWGYGLVTGPKWKW